MSAVDGGPLGGVEWDALARDAHRDRHLDGDTHSLELRELLACQLDRARYAIPVERVREIVRMRPITPIPRTPDWLLGVISLRGEVVQVVDLRLSLGVAAAPAARGTRIVVLHGDDDRVAGVLVDEVREVLRLHPDEISPAASSGLSVVSEVARKGSDFVSILDLDKVLGDHAGS